MGLSGISVTSLSFKTTDSLLNTGVAHGVIVSGISNLPMFYINKRTYNDGIWTVECLDRAAFMDTVIIPENSSQQAWTKVDGKYHTEALYYGLIDQCGVIADLPYSETLIPCEQVDGKTWQTLLTEMSEAYCGCFCCFSGRLLQFIRYDEARSAETIIHYSRIHDNGEYAYSSVKVSNGKDSVLFGTGAPQLCINNDLVYEELDEPPASSLYSGILNHRFVGWSVENAVSELGVLPIIGGKLEFGSVTYTYGDTIPLEYGAIYSITVPTNSEAAGMRVIGPAESGGEFALTMLYTQGGTEKDIYVLPLEEAEDVPSGGYVDLYFLNTPALAEMAAVFADDSCTNIRIQARLTGNPHAQIKMIWSRKTVVVRKRVTRADAHISGGKLVMSVSGEVPQMGEINRRGLLQQKLDDAVSTTKTYKTMAFNPYQGPVLVPNTEG